MKNKHNLLHESLTDQIISAAYSVFTILGYGHPEKIYHKAFEKELIKRNLTFKREKFSFIEYDGEVIGRYFLDFLIENKVAVEFKVRREVYEKDWIQLLNYLKADNMEVGLLIVFKKDKPFIKRVVNQQRSSSVKISVGTTDCE